MHLMFVIYVCVYVIIILCTMQVVNIIFNIFKLLLCTGFFIKLTVLRVLGNLSFQLQNLPNFVWGLLTIWEKEIYENKMSSNSSR